MTADAWQLGSLAFFVYILVVAACLRGLRPAARWRAAAGAAVGAAVIVLSMRLPSDGIANVWILPPAALLIGYWTSGLLFVAPMRRAEFLEFAYSGVYPLIPIALYLALRQGVSADRFWTTILLTDYVCFGMLPWFQTRPPRSAGFDARWRSRWRAVNLRMLEAGSVRVNTFPSGHAAEALAAALLVSGGHPLVAGWMFFNAAAISAGAVFGRYHYAADAVAGWAVALLVYAGSFRL